MMLVVVAGGCASKSPQQYCGEPVTARDSTPREVTVISDDLAPVRDAFNASPDQWRVVSLVSPTCSECIYGAEVVEHEMTTRYPQSKVAAIAIWIPMLSLDNEQAARASATIFRPDRAVQFYDSKQQVGFEYARRTFEGFPERAKQSLPKGHWLTDAFEDRAELIRPQWDLYMLYAPGARWSEGEAPPMPTHWIRHFGRMRDRKTSTYWRDTAESGPQEGSLYDGMRAMTEQSLGKSSARESAMNIEVLGFEGCPHTPRIRKNVEKAAASMGLDVRVSYVDQNKLAENDVRRGWPAPTVLVDGKDLFGMPEPQSAAMACRSYEGGSPSESQIASALRELRGN